MIKLLKVVDKVVDRFASYGLVVSVMLMLFFSVLTILLRWFGTGIHWVEPFVRHLVFLSTFLGGVVATGRGTHIGIDIIGKYLESKGREELVKYIQQVISLVSLGAIIWLVKASYNFVLIELEYGKPVFWGISSGYLVAIIPFGFTLIGIRFLTRFLLLFSKETLAEGVE